MSSIIAIKPYRAICVRKPEDIMRVLLCENTESTHFASDNALHGRFTDFYCYKFYCFLLFLVTKRYTKVEHDKKIDFDRIVKTDQFATKFLFE